MPFENTVWKRQTAYFKQFSDNVFRKSSAARPPMISVSDKGLHKV